MIRRTDLHDLPGLRNRHKSKICLIGDAAHATTPNLGQGGAQAVEDAYTLVNYLRKNNKTRIGIFNFSKKKIYKG